jgi:hypothetical protein
MYEGSKKFVYGTAIVVLLLAVAVGGCCGLSGNPLDRVMNTLGYTDTDTTTAKAQVHGTISAGESVQATQVAIGTNGGTIKVNKPDSPVDGLTITVPSGAYTNTRTFTVSSAPVTGNTFGKYFNAASPLITIDNGGGYADDFITVRIPVNVSPSDFVMAFYYDAANQTLEGIPTIDRDATSITVAALHFCDLIVSNISQSQLDAINTVDSGFMPGRDDWEFINNGSFIAPDGHCAGQTVSMMWYYTEKRQKENAPKLNGLYDNNGREKTPHIYGDDTLGYRLASVVQNDIRFDFYNDKFGNLIRNQSNLTQFDSFKYSILLTGQPQYLRLRRPGGGHAVVCYAVDGNALLIADPNYPGQARRTVLNGNQLGPYSSGANAQAIATSGATLYNVYYAANSAMIPVYGLSARWDQLKAGTIGDSQFPRYNLRIANNTVAGGSGIAFVAGGRNTETVKISTNASKIAIYTLSAGGVANIGGIHPRVFMGEKTVDTNYIDLLPGVNKIGVEVLAGPSGNDWLGFNWLEINYQPDDATPTPTQKPTSTPTPTPLPAGERKPPVRSSQAVTLASVSNPLLPYSETLWDGGTLAGTYYKDANNAVVRHGTFRTMDKNGQLKQEETYSKGQIIGYYRKYASGKLVSEAYDGDNGLKQYEDYYYANGKTSLQRDFREDGITKKTEFNFNEDGTLSSYYEYDLIGKNTLEEHYEKGRLVSSTKH